MENNKKIIKIKKYNKITWHSTKPKNRSFNRTKENSGSAEKEISNTTISIVKSFISSLSEQFCVEMDLIKKI